MLGGPRTTTRPSSSRRRNLAARPAGRGSARVRALAAALLATMLAFAAAAPVEAGRWITGGTFDAQRGVGVSFLRFLAEEGEGQMTIRCDRVWGLWIDAGVTGNGALPDGAAVGSKIAATLTFVGVDGSVSFAVLGVVIVRGDGAVLISIEGADVAPIGRRLLLPAERVDITIGAVTRPVPLAGLLAEIDGLATRCGAWPV